MKKLLIPAVALFLMTASLSLSAQNRSLTKPIVNKQKAKSEIKKTSPAKASEQNEEYLAYCGEEVSPVGIHEGTISAAAYFPPSIVKRLIGNKLTAIATNIPDNNATNLHLWVSTTLGGEHDIADIKVAEGFDVGGPIVVNLDTPYDIKEEGLYIGLTMDCPDGETAAVNCDYDDRDNAFFYKAQGAEWQDLSHTYYGSLYILGVTKGDKMFTDNDLALTNVTSGRTMKGDEVEINLNVYNYGKLPIENITVEYTANGETHTAESFLYDQVYQFQRTSTTIYVKAPNEEGRHAISYTIKKVDSRNNALTADASRSSYIITLEESAPRTVFIEQTENSSDEWESLANLAMQKISESQYADKAIAVGVHGNFDGYNDDYMTDETYSPLFNLVKNPYSEFINRKYIDYAFETYADEDEEYKKNAFRLGSMIDSLVKLASEGDIKLHAAYADSEQKNIIFRSETTFNYNTDEEAPYRVAYILAEKELPNQIMYNRYNRDFMIEVLFEDDEEEFNYFYNTTPNELKPLFDMPYEIEGAIYLNVARSIYTCFGIEGSLSGKLVKGEKKSHSYTVSLPENINDKSQLYAIAILIDGYSGEVVNVTRCDIDEYTGIKSADSDKFTAEINAADGNVVVKTSNLSLVEIYNMEGQLLTQASVWGNQTIPVGNGNNTAIVRVTSENDVVVKRINLR